MKLLAFLFSTLSNDDKDHVKDLIGWILAGATVFSSIISPLIGFIVGVLTIAVLLERYKYYRKKNKHNEPS